MDDVATKFAKWFSTSQTGMPEGITDHVEAGFLQPALVGSSQDHNWSWVKWSSPVSGLSHYCGYAPDILYNVYTLYIYISIYLGKFHHDRTLFSRSLVHHGFYREIIPKIAKNYSGEWNIFWFTQIYIKWDDPSSGLLLIMVKFPTGESDSKNPNGMGWIGRIPWKKWDLWYEYHLFEAQRDIWCMDVYGWLWMVMDGYGWFWMVMDGYGIYG